MEPQFWHDRWEDRKIGFHKTTTNPIIINHFAKLKLAKGARVFVPLCGKSLDIAWLAAQGYQVVGAELSEVAVGEFFAELAASAESAEHAKNAEHAKPLGDAQSELKPTITKEGAITRYSVPGIDILQGNIFDITLDQIGKVDAIYDRAALVALPLELRNRYSAKLRELSGTVPQLLSCFEYDESLMDGPPFCIDQKGIEAQYKEHYTITELDRYTYENQLAGKDIPAIETIWLLTPR